MAYTALDAVKAYLYAWMREDGKWVPDYVTDDIEYVGPLATWKGIEAFTTGAQQLGQIISEMDIQMQWEEGDDVCTIMDLEVKTPKGPVTLKIAEWNKVRDGKVCRSRIICDPREATSAFRIKK